MTSATIAARLTPEVPAAIATIAVRGPAACESVRQFTGIVAIGLPIGKIRYALWRIGGTDRLADHTQHDLCEQVVICQTADQCFEIHCHGGPAVCQAVLRNLESVGCKVVSSSQWPSDFACPLAQAAEQDLIRVATDKAAAILLDQLHGALRLSIESARQALRAGEHSAATIRLQEMVRWAELGLHLATPWRIVLAGPPNVGKSSLLNELAGTHQSIVHHEPGTTRDWIEYRGAIDGWPMTFTDTAGIRSTEDEIELAGVRQSSRQIQRSDLVVIVVDASQGWCDTHNELLRSAPRRRIVVWNKVDLGLNTPSEAMPSQLVSAELMQVSTSTVAAPGVDPLLRAIVETLVPTLPEAGTAVPFRAEQVALLTQALKNISANQLELAEQALATLLGPDAVQL